MKTNESLDFNMVKNLIKYLELAFDDSNEKDIAQYELYKLYQTN